MKSITDWLTENGIAHHWKHAQNITRLLDLGELYNAKRFDEIRARAKLYRELRAGEAVQGVTRGRFGQGGCRRDGDQGRD